MFQNNEVNNLLMTGEASLCCHIVMAAPGVSSGVKTAGKVC